MGRGMDCEHNMTTPIHQVQPQAQAISAQEDCKY